MKLSMDYSSLSILSTGYTNKLFSLVHLFLIIFFHLDLVGIGHNIATTSFCFMGIGHNIATTSFCFTGIGHNIAIVYKSEIFHTTNILPL